MSATATLSSGPPTPVAPVAQPLGTVPSGKMATILDVRAPAIDSRRLKAMGLCAGRTVRVVSAGNPMIVQVLGSRVGLSASLAQQVMVEAC